MDADRRLTIEGEVLDVVSNHGGERIIAGPQMEALVRELADLVLRWAAVEETSIQALSCLDVPEFHCHDGEHCNCPRCHLASAFPGFRDMSHDDAIEHWAREQDGAGEGQDHLRNEVDSQHMADYMRAQ